MRVISAVLVIVTDIATVRTATVRNRLYAVVERLVGLTTVLVAVAIAVGYQVLRHLPESWRDALLADDEPAE
jgi:hypothetical protein